MRQPTNEMTAEELQAENEFWEFFYAECEMLGQGISTKEAVRKRAVDFAIFQRSLGLAA